MKKMNLLILILMVATFALTTTAQKNFDGSWEWKSHANKNKEQAVVWVTINQKGNKVSGNYAFAQLIAGENDGSDSSFVPFAGTIKGSAVKIEFNAGDIHGIEDDPNRVRYKKVKSPSTATLILKNGQLEWTLIKGDLEAGDLNVPRQMTLKRLR